MLTFIQIKAIAPPDKGLKEYPDGNGLYLRVWSSGRKVWHVNKSLKGKRIVKDLGTFPEVGIAEARELLQKELDLAARAKNTVNTFKTVYDDFLIVKASHVLDVRDMALRFENYLIPSLGSKEFQNITPQEVIDTLKENCKDKLSTIKRLCAWIGQLERYAYRRGITDKFKLQGLAEVFPRHIKDKMPSIHPNELPEAMQIIKMSGYHQAQIWKAFQIMFFTLLRPNEVCKLKWEYIDLENKVITIPADVMKMKKEHKVPIVNQLEKLLKELPRLSEYVLPMENKNGYIYKETLSSWLVRHGLKDKLVPHGIRSIGRTWMTENNIRYDVAEMCLAHKVGSEVSLSYNRTDLLELRRNAMQSWSDYVEDCITGYALAQQREKERTNQCQNQET